MQEFEDFSHTHTTEELKQDLFEFLKDAEFGSPKHQAFFDYYILNRYWDSFRRKVDSLTEDKFSDQRDKLSTEGSLRILETQIALLENQVETNKSRVKGYGLAYAHIWLSFEDIGSAASREAKAKHSSKTEAELEANRNWDEVLGKAMDLILSKIDK